MRVVEHRIPGVLELFPKVFGDARGFFVETYQHARYAEAGIEAAFVQDNVSRSARGVLRGLHLQNPTIADLSRTREALRVVDDQRGRPTSVVTLAPTALELLAAGALGTFHATDAGECSWFELDRRRRRGDISREDADRLASFIRDGYVVLPNAVEHSVLDALVEDIEHAWKHGSDRVRVDILGTVVPLRPEHREQPFKLLDLYVSSDAARNISCAPAIAHFLQLLFETRVLAFQSLTFEKGTEQRLHQDTAYVVVSEPLKLAASWVALEDISPGTGELEYFVGSHRLPDRPLSEVYKHFNPERDGNQSHEDFLDWLERESRARGLARTRFQPKKGDALIRAADLVHGGSKIEVPGRSRRSHVTHYCPVGVTPN